jgi:hypothetical protein
MIQPGLPICMALLAIVHTLKNDKGMRREKEMLRIGISYMICIPHTESCCFTNEREVSSFSWSSRSPFSPSCHTGCLTIVDVWDWSPLAVNKASHNLGSEEVETPTLPHTISIIGHERLLWPCLSCINSEVLNYSFCSLDLQQVSTESHPFLPLILWNEFKAHFRAHYVPRGTMKLKKKEFADLK